MHKTFPQTIQDAQGGSRDEIAADLAGNFTDVHPWHELRYEIADLEAQGEDLARWGAIDTGRGYDHAEIIDISNAAAIDEDFSPYVEDGSAVPTHHGYLIRVFDEDGLTSPVAEEWIDLAGRLADYPIIDEDDYCRREHEETIEAIEGYGVDPDRARDVFSYLFNCYSVCRADDLQDVQILEARVAVGEYTGDKTDPDERAAVRAIRCAVRDDEDPTYHVRDLYYVTRPHVMRQDATNYGRRRFSSLCLPDPYTIHYRIDHKSRGQVAREHRAVFARERAGRRNLARALRDGADERTLRALVLALVR